MNTTRTIALTLAAIAGTATIHTATAAATPNCNGTAAITNTTINITDHTYRATWTTRPGCDNTPITIAAHDTAQLTWDPTEVQPLIASHTVPASAGRLEWTLPAGVAPRCRLQLDFVTGPALDVVDGAHRYNETAIGGTSNRLIDARYTDSDCTPTTTTSTPPAPTEPPASAPTTATWIDQMPPATVTPMPQPPGIDTPSTSPVPDVQLTDDPTPYTAVPTLPVTGSNSLQLLWAGAAALALGIITLGLAKCRRQNVATHNAHLRNMESE